MGEELIPIKLGVLAQPPALTLVYRNNTGKERQRTMPVRFLNKFGSVNTVVTELKKRHNRHLEKVSELKVEKMLRILQEVQKGQTIDEAVVAVTKEYEVDPDQDLNKVSEEELAKKKKIMENSFEKNQVKPGDPDYKYDKQVDFSCDDKAEAGWDSPEGGSQEDDFWS
ncbi:centrosomal protein of 19 kDa-like [Palaemon carinicauda]|uniref:centrosomal protein of 19 kDa-like n=1 Tax=Palaemon carinicauda TaxID=392227 RepID=UPI0035B61F06